MTLKPLTVELQFDVEESKNHMALYGFICMRDMKHTKYITKISLSLNEADYKSLYLFVNIGFVNGDDLQGVKYLFSTKPE